MRKGCRFTDHHYEIKMLSILRGRGEKTQKKKKAKVEKKGGKRKKKIHFFYMFFLGPIRVNFAKKESNRDE